MMLHQSFNFSTIRSTQDEAKKIAKRLPPKTVAVVSAEVQEGGKGRNQRDWISPKGNLYLTFILPIPEAKKGQGATLSLVLATTAAEFLQSEGVDVRLKWPNDLLIEGAKVGGILGEGGDPLFLGIGINIASHPYLDRPTISLNEWGNHPFDLKRVKEGVVETFLQGYERWLEEGFTPFFALWSSFLIHKRGDEIVVKGEKGVFLQADTSGGIWIERGGRKELVVSGEVEI